MVGLWVSLPLPGNAACVAHVVRQRGSRLYAYFFDVGNAVNVTELGAGDAFYAGEVGYLGIRRGTWAIVGRSSVVAADWPVIGRTRPLIPEPGDSITAYGLGDDLNTEIFSFPITFEEVEFLETGSMGHVFAEIRMERLIAGRSRPLRTHAWWDAAIELHRAHSDAETPAPHKDQVYGVRIEISSPWSGNIDELIKRLRRALPPGDEVDGWLIGDEGITIYLYGSDWQRLFARVATTARAGLLPLDTIVTAADHEGDVLKCSSLEDAM